MSFEKRIYSKPEVIIIDIDNEITLVMTSEGNPGGGAEGAPQAASNAAVTKKKSPTNSFQKNPFNETK